MERSITRGRAARGEAWSARSLTCCIACWVAGPAIAQTELPPIPAIPAIPQTTTTTAQPVTPANTAAVIQGITGQQDKSGGGGGKDDEVELPSFSEVRVSEFLTVDLIAQNEDIRTVLQKLAVQSRRNIVPSLNVRNRVTCTVYGAAFYDALDALLTANGLGYLEKGDFIYVYTALELAAIKNEERRRESRRINLDYLRPDDAKRFADSIRSEKGVIEVTTDESGGSGGGGGGGGNQNADAAAGVYTPDKDEFSVYAALIVHDYPENIAEIEELIKTLDTKPAQVLLESTIMSASLEEANGFGVDFAVLKEVQFTDFFNFPDSFNPIDFKGDIDGPPQASDPVTRDQRDFVASTPGNTGLGRATIRGGYVQDDIGVFIRALDEVSDVTLLSNPKVLTLNRQRARVLVGTRVGYLETSVVENQVLQTVKFIDTGIELDIRPFVLRDNVIRLELAPKVSDVDFRTVTGAGGQSQQIPDENLQTVNTNVQVPAGYTAVLGGLFREDIQRDRSQVPVVGDIPILGAAFQGRDDITQRSEIIFMIKPTIMQDNILITQGDRANEWGRALLVGSREGLLPWSRERQSARLNLDAERQAAEGDINAALWSVRRSLSLNPIQPDAVRIREKLVSSPTVWPSRSFLDQIIAGEAGENVSVRQPPAAAPAPAAPPALAPPPPVFDEPEAELEPPSDPEPESVDQP
ncbi:MAG: hypothetical protein SFZ24_10400 [Planctomycetota bacterium]|nr:hypothetical protein [Planctomycetota bacterium]